MIQFPKPYQAIEGKTYSLFGKSENTTNYYQKIENLANVVLEKNDDINFVVKTIQDFSSKKRLLNKIAGKSEHQSLISFIVHLLNQQMSGFTEKTDEHLKSLPIWKFRDRRLRTSRIQYHLYMLEIEMINRLYSEKFNKADKKIALLPHCLRDFKVECKAAPDDFDYQCKHCSKICYQNHVSQILKKNSIDAYIWMQADLKKEIKSIIKSNKNPGILGIACIPELVMGMRKCQKLNIPVIGLPLDANRCARWMGSFNENSVNFEMLEKLIRQ